MWYVYLLKSVSFRKSYVGCTDNVKRRLDEHNSGKSLFTKRFKPWQVLKVEEFRTYKDARKRERFYKSGIGRQEMKKLF